MDSEETKIYTPIETPRRRRQQAQRLLESKQPEAPSLQAAPAQPAAPPARPAASLTDTREMPAYERTPRAARSAVSRATVPQVQQETHAAQRAQGQYSRPTAASQRYAYAPLPEAEQDYGDPFEQEDQDDSYTPPRQQTAQRSGSSATGASKPPRVPVDEMFDDIDGKPDRGRRRRGCFLPFVIIVLVIALGLTAVWYFARGFWDETRDAIMLSAPVMYVTDRITEFKDSIFAPREGQPDATQKPRQDAAVLDIFNDSADTSDPSAAVQFTIRTTIGASRVRLLDYNGEAIGELGANAYTEIEGVRQWVAHLTLNRQYEGKINAQAGDAENWISNADAMKSVDVRIGVAAPTQLPTAAPTPTPGPTETPEPTPEPEPTPTPEPTPNPFVLQTVTGSDAASPDKLSIKSDVLVEGNAITNYSRSKNLVMGAPEDYNKAKGVPILRGVSTFRGGPFRQNAAYGTISPAPSKMEIVWENGIGALDNYTGIGWTGQPAIVCWPNDIRLMMNIVEAKKEKEALREVIYAGMDGKIYFFDMDDGVPTRNPIDIGFPLKGSVAVHPYGIPFMTVGQGVSVLNNSKGSIGVHGINLIDQSSLFLINGQMKEANESSGAFDGTPLIDPATHTMIETGENGLFYTVDLGLQFSTESKTLTSMPSSVMYRFQAGSRRTGIEASPAVYGQYAYFADASGILQCVDMKTMMAVWAFDTLDNNDATPALEVEADGRVALYTANTVQNRKTDSDATIWRINALTGEEEWKYSIRCETSSQAMGGFVASPVVGKNSLDNLVFFTAAKTSEGGTLLALDKQTGDVAWRVSTESYSWSSPVAVYDETGHGWIIQANSKGALVMYDGLTGKEVARVKLSGNVEGSPAVYNDILVVGTRDKKIYGIKIQ